LKAPGSAGMKIPETTEKLVNLLSYSSDKTLAEKCRLLTPEDWQVVLEEGEQRGLALVLYARLCAAGGDGLVPAWVMERLRQAYLAATARNMVMLHHAGAILKGLKERGIEAIVLKGLYLVEHVYPQIGLRTFSDLDLLVRRSDLDAALHALQETGYRLTTWYDPADPNQDIKHLPPLEKEGWPLVELHWSILEEDAPFPVDVEGIWQRAVPARVAGADVLAMDKLDLILHLAIHNTYQHKLRGGLRSLYDIALILHQNPDQINWPGLIERASGWKMERVLWLTLCLLRSLLGTEIPQAVMQQLEPQLPDLGVLEEAQRQMVLLDSEAPLTPDLAALSQTSGLVSRLKLVWSRIFLPRRVLARIYNPPVWRAL